MRERYRHMMEHVTLDEEKREKIRDKMLEQRPTRQSARPLRAAMAAACVCLLLVGTVLATSSELRSLLWGSFQPYVEEIDPEVEPEAVGVYDGIEARIVSAVSDGHITVGHVEFRDLEGDRIAQLMAQGREAAQEELRGFPHYMVNVYDKTPSLGYTVATFGGNTIVDYDGESGVLTLEYFAMVTTPSQSDPRLMIYLPIGFLRTWTDRGPEEGGRDYELYKWQLRTSISTLSTRDIPVDDVEVTMLDWKPYFGADPSEVDPTITLQKVMVSPVAVSILHSAFQNADPKSMELVVELADGTTVGSSRYGKSTFQDHDTAIQIELEDEDSILYLPRTHTSNWLLEQAIDPDQVVGLWVEGVYLPMN